MFGMLFLMSHVSALGVHRGSECDQDIDFDTTPLRPEQRRKAEEHPVIRAEELEVISTADLDALLDLF
jgi:hypothetical protein